VRFRVFLEVDDRQLAAVEVELLRFVTKPEIDSPFLPSVLWRENHEVLDIPVWILDVVWHPTGAVRDIISPFEDGDPGLGTASSNLAGSAHPGGDPADYDYPVWNLQFDLQYAE
jgi:hypothetical protein